MQDIAQFIKGLIYFCSYKKEEKNMNEIKHLRASLTAQASQRRHQGVGWSTEVSLQLTAQYGSPLFPNLSSPVDRERECVKWTDGDPDWNKTRQNQSHVQVLFGQSPSQGATGAIIWVDKINSPCFLHSFSPMWIEKIITRTLFKLSHCSHCTVYSSSYWDHALSNK